MATLPIRRLRWRSLFIIEAAGLRTTLAVIVPLVIGQIAGSPAVGLMVGAGALQVSFIDRQGATIATLLWGTLGCVMAVLLGGVVSNSMPIVAVALMFVIALLLGMFAALGDVAGNIGFIILLTYASAQSLPISLHHDAEHLLGFASGGVWAIILTVLLWRLRRAMGDRRAGSDTGAAEPDDGTMPESMAPPGADRAALPWRQALVRNLTHRSPILQHAARTAIAAAAAVAIGREFHPAHSFWLILTVLVIIKPEYALTRKRTLERVLGSVVGGLAAIMVVPLIHDVVLLDLAIFLFGVLAFSHLPRNYGLYVFFLTPFIVLITSLAAPSDGEVALARIYQTLLGGALGLLVASVLRVPRHVPFRGIVGRKGVNRWLS